MFKKAVVILASAVMFSCAPARAQQHTVPYIDMDCSEMSAVAEMIMKARQQSLPMAEAHKVAKKSKSPSFAAWATEIIKIAYASPRFSSKEFQQRAINDFGSDVYLACLKAGN